MRAIVFPFLLLASCAAPAPQPAPAPKPSAFDEPITLNLQRASLTEAFDQIARRSGLRVLLNNDLGSGTITMSVTHVPVGDVLEAVAATFNLKVTRLAPEGMVRISKP